MWEMHSAIADLTDLPVCQHRQCVNKQYHDINEILVIIELEAQLDTYFSISDSDGDFQ